MFKHLVLNHDRMELLNEYDILEISSETLMETYARMTLFLRRNIRDEWRLERKIELMSWRNNSDNKEISSVSFIWVNVIFVQHFFTSHSIVDHKV